LSASNTDTILYHYRGSLVKNTSGGIVGAVLMDISDYSPWCKS